MTTRIERLTPIIDLAIPGGRRSRYEYRGWIITQEYRDWDARPYKGSTGNPTQRWTWKAKKRNAPKYTETGGFFTRHAAVEYVDQKEDGR